MAEERMLNDEILLGLIKANSGGGGGGTTDYDDLNNKPQIGGVTLSGNKSASDLGLVASVDGKGLSTNDYTDADKAIVGGVTAALAGKQDALTAGDYIEIDGNEISVNPVVPNEEATYQIVSDGQEGGTYFVRINKIVDGEVVLTERYSTVDNVKRTFDDTIRIDYANTVGWNFTYELLVASTTHDAGYTYSWGYSAQVDIDEVVVTADHSGESLVLKSQMDTALTGKQDTLTFDSVPTDGSTNPVESNGVYDALALKQNATDNNLTTTSKTVVGAVNELKSGLTTLDNEVNGDATVYPYADVITIPDAIPANLACCAVKIEPVQSGSGDPSPTNVRPITGHTEASVQRTGKNLCDKGEGNIYNGGKLIPVSAGDKIYCYGEWVSDNKSFYGAIFSTPTETSKGNKIAILDDFYTGVSKEMTIPTNGYFGVCFDTSVESYTVSKMMISKTPITSATDYEPYQGKTYTIALGDTIYGGTVDFKTGVMTVDRAVVDLGTLTWQKDSGSHSRFVANNAGMKLDGKVIADCFQYGTYNEIYAHTKDEAISISNVYSQFAIHSTYYEADYDATQFKTAMDGHYACYQLATPLTIQLTPQQIQLLKGTNTLTASTGQISVTVNGVSGSIGQVQEQVNDHEERIEAVESLEKPSNIIALLIAGSNSMATTLGVILPKGVVTATIIRVIPLGSSGIDVNLPLTVVNYDNNSRGTLDGAYAAVGSDTLINIAREYCTQVNISLTY